MKLLFEKHLSKRKPPVNLKVADVVLFANELEKEINNTHLLELKNAVVSKDCIINSVRLRKYAGYTHINTISNKSLAKRLLLILAGAEKIDEGIWIIDEWSNGYFHWLTDALPRLLAADEVNNQIAIILPEHYKHQRFITESLELLNRRVTYYSHSKALRVGTLLLPSHTAGTGNYNHKLINQVRAAFTLGYPKNGKRKIFISRQKASRRKIDNETDVIALLKQFDFEIHHFEDYSFAKQVEIMAQCQCVAGLHGAGLTNMLFMHAGGKVLEFRNADDNHSNCYFSLASELGHDYYYQICKSNSRNPHLANCIVNLNELRKNLEAMHEHK